jgi:hypothetical protein
LRELVSDDLIQEKDFADWKIPGQHWIPTPSPDEIVMFISFVRASLCLSASAFLYRFLQYFGICLNHLTPNGVLHLSMFVHLCEPFLGILPSISLFCYFFHMKPHPRSDNISPLGGCGIQFCQGKENLFFDYDLVDSLKEWCSSGFMLETCSLLLLFILILVPRSMIVGRRTLCRAKSLRRSNHCLIEFGF